MNRVVRGSGARMQLPARKSRCLSSVLGQWDQLAVVLLAGRAADGSLVSKMSFACAKGGLLTLARVGC